jgi:hypothetical protein
LAGTEESGGAAILDPLVIEYVPTVPERPVSEEVSQLAFRVGRAVITRALASALTRPAALYRAFESDIPDPKVVNARSIPAIRCIYPVPEDRPVPPPNYALLDRSSLAGAHFSSRNLTIGHCLEGMLKELEKGSEELRPGRENMLYGGLILRSKTDLLMHLLGHRPARAFPSDARGLITLALPVASMLLVESSGGRRLPTISVSSGELVLPDGTYLRPGAMVRREGHDTA